MEPEAEQGEVTGAHRGQVGGHRWNFVRDAGEMLRSSCSLGYVDTEGEVPSKNKAQPGSPKVEAQEGGLRHQGDFDMRACQKHPCVHCHLDGGRRPVEERGHRTHGGAAL